MIPYVAAFVKNGEPYVTCLYGKDRDDVILFIKKHYRTQLGKIVSVRQVNPTTTTP